MADKSPTYVMSLMPDSTTDKHSTRKHDRVRGDAKKGEKKSRLRSKGEREGHKGKKHKRNHDHKVTDEEDEDVWIEKNIDGELPQNTLITEPQSSQTGELDFFSSLGTERKRKGMPERSNPDKLVVSSKEINPHSLDKSGMMEATEKTKDDRRVIDEREGRRASYDRSNERGKSREATGVGEQRYMFSEVGAAAIASRSSSSFRRPGGQDNSTSSTPSASRGSVPPANRRLDSLRLPSEASSAATSFVSTPIPTVMTPPTSGQKGVTGLSQGDLNKLQAQVLKAKLMGNPNAAKLQQEYDVEVAKSHGGGHVFESETKARVRVEVLPTMDARGRLYDVGQGKNDGPAMSGNRKRKDRVETHDTKTGEFVRYNADDDSTTLGDMLRQEKFGAGMADQKDFDAELARAIMGDGKFQNDLEYMDDNAEKLGRKKMRSDAMKRQFAIHDYARTKKVLDTCYHCYGEDDSLPKAPIIAMATRCYLACPPHEELVKGHCHIVPIQHHLSTLEGDDDMWDEIRNFMKCLMRMYVEEDKGVVFYETVLNIKWQKHTYIECVPVPWAIFELLPAYFKESILQSESEWSQHKKLIDFSARPGGFRRAMVPNLPYFMVQWDHKGEKGYGHVIEGVGAGRRGETDGAFEGDEDGGEFPQYFAAEIIGNQLDVEPRRWRRPKKIDFRFNKERVATFRGKYQKYDWTGMIQSVT